MKRIAAFLIFHLSLAALHAASPLLIIDNVQLSSPASVGAHTPQFVTANGRVLLSFIQPGPDNLPAHLFARYDPQTRAWSDPVLACSTDTRQNSILGTNTESPKTVSNSGRIASVCFIADARDPRVLLSFSPDGGEHFLMPLHVEDSKPVGAPDLVLLADGTIFVSWLEQADNDEISIWFRRISSNGELSVPIVLANLPTHHTAPRLALIKDYDATSAQLLLAYTLGESDTSQIITRLLTIPIPSAVAAKPCNCPGEEAARGYALKGRVISIIAARETLAIQHEEIPGVLAAGTTEFKTDPSLLKFATTGNEVYARIEKRDNQWWLFGARLIMRP